MKFSSLATLKVVILTIFSATSDENFIKMTCSFQWWYWFQWWYYCLLLHSLTLHRMLTNHQGIRIGHYIAAKTANDLTLMKRSACWLIHHCRNGKLSVRQPLVAPINGKQSTGPSKGSVCSEHKASATMAAESCLYPKCYNFSVWILKCTCSHLSCLLCVFELFLQFLW